VDIPIIPSEVKESDGLNQKPVKIMQPNRVFLLNGNRAKYDYEGYYKKINDIIKQEELRDKTSTVSTSPQADNIILVLNPLLSKNGQSLKDFSNPKHLTVNPSNSSKASGIPSIPVEKMIEEKINDKPTTSSIPSNTSNGSFLNLDMDLINDTCYKPPSTILPKPIPKGPYPSWSPNMRSSIGKLFLSPNSSFVPIIKHKDEVL